MTSAEATALIIDAVADKYGLTAGDIMSARRNARFAWARQVSVALTQEMTGETNRTVAALFGLDATTVSYATRHVAAEELVAPKVAADLADIRKSVEACAPRLAERRGPAAAGALRGFTRDAAGDPTEVERELGLLLKELRRSLAAALRVNPGAVLGGLGRVCREINDEEARR